MNTLTSSTSHQSRWYKWNNFKFRKTGADIQTKVEELEELNQSLRQRDKVKDDAIAQLSDQLVSLSARLQEIERRQEGGRDC